MNNAQRKAMFAKLRENNRMSSNDIIKDTYYAEGGIDIPLIGHVKGGVKHEVFKSSNPHLIESNDHWSAANEYKGYMVSRFVKPHSQQQ